MSTACPGRPLASPGDRPRKRFEGDARGVQGDVRLTVELLVGQADAPDIDCLVRVKGKNLRPGDLVSVKITSADGYDLVGRTLGAVR